MGKYRRKYRHYDDDDFYDYDSENPIGALLLFGFLYIWYVYYTDKITFWRWFAVISIILILLVAGYIAFKIWNKKKSEKILASYKNLNADIEQMVAAIKPDKIDNIVKTNTNSSTPQAKALHIALESRGIKCELEKWDGYKHIDIAIPWARINIEIDGIQHYTDPKQIESDYYRSYYSVKKGFKTIRYPNFVIDKYLDRVADGIAKVARIEYNKK